MHITFVVMEFQSLIVILVLFLPLPKLSVRFPVLIDFHKSELDKSVVMAWVGSPAQSKMSLFLEYQFPQKSVVMSLKTT